MNTELEELDEVTPLKVLRDNEMVQVLPIMGKRPVVIKSIKDARRLLSRLITGLQQQTVSGDVVKTLVYVLQAYVQTARLTDVEERLDALEKGVHNEPSKAA